VKRVAVTGLGLVTPVGTGRDTFWTSIIEGRSGVAEVRSFDTSDYHVHLGAEVDDFEPEAYVRQDFSQMGRASRLAIGAVRQALDDSGLSGEWDDPRRVGICMGTTSGEPLFVEAYNDAKHRSEPLTAPKTTFGRYPCYWIASHVAAEFDSQGPCMVIPTACAAGNYAIASGFDWIRSGVTEVVLAGGADAFSRIPYAGFARLGAIAPDCCRPFDRNRKGMIPGEGAGALVLEEWSAARARGATIYAEVLGYGLSCDAHHMTAAHPEGEGAMQAMQGALRSAGMTSDDVDYISAHGTGTPTNDRVEAIALTRVFGDRAPNVPMSSIKSMLGHTMGAASAIEAATCALALSRGVIPPTMNYEESDPECEVDCVPNEARETKPRVALNNAYAFGGNNASLCLGRVEAA